jgi:hypothetical protein
MNQSSQNVYLENSTHFIHPFSCIISGASQSGKTVFVTNFIKHLDCMVSPQISRVYIIYSHDQPAYSEMRALDSRVSLVNSFDFEANTSDNTLIIIDDQMNKAMKDTKILDLFTKGVHHNSISVVLITQDLFPPEKYARTIRRNATYLIIFKSPTFRSQIQDLGRQLYPEAHKFLCSAYNKATEAPYSYIFVNLHARCHEDLRIRSGILPYQDTFVYLKH